MFGCSVYSIVSDKIHPVPSLYCVEIQRHPRDLGISIVLPATCELMARCEVLRLFPEYRNSVVGIPSGNPILPFVFELC